MRYRLATLTLVSVLLGCDRLLPSDDPAPAAVAPIAPPTVSLRTNAPSGVTLFVDGRDSGALTTGRQLQLDPGPHAFEARRGNEVLARVERTLASGDSVELAVDVPAPAPVQPATPAGPATSARSTEERGSRTARVSLGDVTLEGDAEASTAALVRAVRSHIRQVQGCYERLLEAEPGLAGTVRVRITAQPNGTVRTVEPVDPGHEGLSDCVTRMARRLRLGAGASAEPVRYVVPLTFTAPTPAAPGRATPSRTDIVAAMHAVEPAVRACGDGHAGMATVRFTFGGDGAVRDATVSGSIPASVRTCVEGAVRTAHVPPFTGDTFSLNYPFRL